MRRVSHLTCIGLVFTATTVVGLQCPKGLPGGSKYLICLSGTGTPAAQPEPYPIQLGEPGLQFLTSKAGIYGTDNIRLFRRQALDFFFTYFHLNYEESLVTSGTTYEQLYQPSEGPDNTAGQTLWILQSYALDPYGTLPSLQRLCGSLGCADISAGQIPIYMGGYQLQIMQPFTARDGSKFYPGDLLMYSIAAVKTSLLTSINAQRDNGGRSAFAGQIIRNASAAGDNNGYTLLYMQSKPGSSLSVNRYFKNGAHVTDESAQLQMQSSLLGNAGQTQYYYYVQNPIGSSGNMGQPNFESVTLQEVLQFY